MFCKMCGQQIQDTAVVCVHCGAATPNMAAYQQRQQPQQPQITVVNSNTANAYAAYPPRVVYVPVKKKSSTGLVIAIILGVLLLAGLANSKAQEAEDTTETTYASEAAPEEESTEESLQ